MRTLYGADKSERLAARAMRIPKTYKLQPGPAGCAVYVGEGEGRYYVMAFRGTAARPEFHIIYRTAEQRQAAIEQFRASVQHRQESKAKRSAEKSAWKNPAKVGDILYTSWGYDQTNVDFYAVTKVSGKRVWIRPIVQDSESTGFMQEKCWPAMPIRFVEESKGEPEGDAFSRLLRGHETMHIAQPCDKGYSIKIGHHYAWLEQGREHFSSSYA